ncbi:hypothetical protein FGIG_08631 [Fasciola gigantica]|uniref:SCP domain-containing protein n=1 Tax=Fasciola gigantica TaxID=46835 RepID=A0A504YT90_FASGI|nr:hypothetical protein FGIG_08631 [Fasciola gigantica]
MRHTWLQWICLIFSSMILLKFSLVIAEGSRWPREDDDVNTLMISWHNEARRRMSKCLVPGQPASEKLPELVYDQQLAEQAQRWSNNCTLNHDKPSDRKHPKWQYVGQNWAADHSYESTFNVWFDEHMNYTFDTMQCDPGAQCGHYTAIVSARTTHIGCGSAMCKKSLRFPWRVTVTCNYGPNGNVRDTHPYKKADPAVCKGVTKLDTPIASVEKSTIPPETAEEKARRVKRKQIRTCECSEK